MGLADAVASHAESMPARLYPIRARDPRSMAQLRRRIKTKTLVRVRTAERTFVGHVSAVSDSGLVSPRPRKPDEWSGPTELLAWDQIQAIEVRRRDPLLTGAFGLCAGALLGGGIGYADYEAHGGNDLAKVLVVGSLGAAFGLPVGVVYGAVFPIWYPLYHAP